MAKSGTVTVIVEESPRLEFEITCNPDRPPGLIRTERGRYLVRSGFYADGTGTRCRYIAHRPAHVDTRAGDAAEPGGPRVVPSDRALPLAVELKTLRGLTGTTDPLGLAESRGIVERAEADTAAMLAALQAVAACPQAAPWLASSGAWALVMAAIKSASPSA